MFLFGFSGGVCRFNLLKVPCHPPENLFEPLKVFRFWQGTRKTKGQPSARIVSRAANFPEAFADEVFGTNASAWAETTQEACPGYDGCH